MVNFNVRKDMRICKTRDSHDTTVIVIFISDAAFLNGCDGTMWDSPRRSPFMVIWERSCSGGKVKNWVSFVCNWWVFPIWSVTQIWCIGLAPGYMLSHSAPSVNFLSAFENSRFTRWALYASIDASFKVSRATNGSSFLHRPGSTLLFENGL